MRSSLVILGNAKVAFVQAGMYNDLFFGEGALYLDRGIRRRRRRVLARIWARHGLVPAWLRYSS